MFGKENISRLITITTADSAPKDLEFFVENHLNQVFTHPYTTQENGHIESFHAIGQ
jgi:hypothetical protein